MTQSALPAAFLPTSLIDGVEAAACNALGIKRLRHRSALQSLRLDSGVDLAELVHRIVSSNWSTGRAASNKNRSGQNWRWALQPQIGERNRSPEVVLERAIAGACVRGGRIDWANQIPVASGLISGAADGRRALDLAYRSGERRFQLIELKIASDTPLYAAVELLGYASACCWRAQTRRRVRPYCSRPNMLIFESWRPRHTTPPSTSCRWRPR